MSPKFQTTVSVAFHSLGAACQCLDHPQPGGIFQRFTDISDLELALLDFSDIIYFRGVQRKDSGLLICKVTVQRRLENPSLSLETNVLHRLENSQSLN